MGVIKIIGGLLLLVVIAIGATAFGARFADGPIALFPGGPLRSGTVVTDAVTDWSFARDTPEIELQLSSQDRSRTVWIGVHQGSAYIPASLDFPPGKTWHKLAVEDGRATLRIDGQRYPVTLVRTEDGSEQDAVRELLGAKYDGGPPGGGGAWFFRVSSRKP